MIGQTISHYKITAKLGEGGMGVVYKAGDTKLDRTVAVKFIAANLIKDADPRKRFDRAAKAAAGVSHDDVCHVYEITEQKATPSSRWNLSTARALTSELSAGRYRLGETWFSQTV